MDFKKAVLIFLTASCFCSCTPNKHAMLSADLQAAMSILGFESLMMKEILLVVPRTGCMGCISSSEAFIQEAYNSYAGVMNILHTDIMSYKTARVKFGEDFLNAPSVFVDTKSVFTEGELSSLYPLIIELKDGKIVDVQYVSPENPYAFDTLKLRLESNTE